MVEHLWRRLLWGLSVTTQIPEPFGQSLPTRQWGWGRCGRSLVTKEAVTVTFFKWSMGPWIWRREPDKKIEREKKEEDRKTVNTSSPSADGCTDNEMHPGYLKSNQGHLGYMHKQKQPNSPPSHTNMLSNLLSVATCWYTRFKYAKKEDYGRKYFNKRNIKICSSCSLRKTGCCNLE